MSAGVGAALVVAKATVVLLLAAGAAFAARDASAARRHLVWLVALVACGALIPASLLGRAIPVRWPALRAPTPHGVAVAPRPRAAALRADVRTSTLTAPTSPRRRADDGAAPPAPRLTAVILAVWAIGALACAARVGAAHRTIARIVAQSRELDVRRWVGESPPAGANWRAPSVRVAAAVHSPFTAGVVRPTILLPADAEAWPVERRRAVLAHEAAHVARADAATQAIGLIVCAVYWFHPLAWLALSRLRAEAEHAADDRVIVDVMSPLAYAGHLVDVARGAGGATSVAALAVGMTDMPPLERRCRAMLDRTRSRAGVSPRATVLTTSLAAAVAIPVGALRPAPVPAATRAAVTSRARPAASTAGEGRRVARSAAGVSRDPRAPRRTTPPRVSPLASSATAPPPSDEPSQPAVPPVTQAAAAHPNFEGTWVLPWSRSECPRSWSASTCTTTLVIAQTESSLAMTSQRPATSGRGVVGTFQATMWVPFDGSAATVTGAVNGVPLTGVSYSGRWIGDTLTLTWTEQNDRGERSGALEYAWLSSDGRTLYWQSAPWTSRRGFLFDSTSAFTRK